MATKPVVVGVDGSEESLLAAEWVAMRRDGTGGGASLEFIRGKTLPGLAVLEKP